MGALAVASNVPQRAVWSSGSSSAPGAAAHTVPSLLKVMLTGGWIFPGPAAVGLLFSTALLTQLEVPVRAKRTIVGNPVCKSAAVKRKSGWETTRSPCCY